MCQDCFRSSAEAPSTLCITRDTVDVCVRMCVGLQLPAAPTPHCVLPKFIAHQFDLVGGTRLLVSRLRSILRPVSIHHVYHEGLCVCLCLFVCHCLLPPPPSAPSRCSLPINFFGGRTTSTCVKIGPIICRGSIDPVYQEGHSLCVCVCVCVCVSVFAIACSHNPHCVLPMFIAH